MATNKFHYIWMGRLPTGTYENAFKEGPNTLAKQLEIYTEAGSKNRAALTPNPQDQEIIMWVPEALIEGIQEAGLLESNITLKAVEDLYENPKHFTKEEIKQIETTVELLGDYNAYASQKDILSATILEEYGGYFMDTTTKVDAIEHLINNQPKEIWFPRITNHAEKIYDGDAVILPDVWALYNPKPNSGTFKAMTASYVQRCQFFFPEAFEKISFDLSKIQDSNGELKSGYFSEDCYGKGSELMSTNDRDELIGQTAIFSLMDGLKKTKGMLTDDRMRKLSSLAQNAPKGKRIEALGIEKTHQGMWRQKKMADVIDARPKEMYQMSMTTTAKTDWPYSVRPERQHLFSVSTTHFKQFKAKYTAFKGDKLKHEIIQDFEKKLTAITNEESLNHFIADFKKSTSYRVLATGQDLTTRALYLETTSLKTINSLIKNKKEQLIETKSSIKW